jgi:lipopolysaccharide biosynthesis glycosyltransferase
MIRVFIGTEPKTEVACQVLEASIRWNTSAQVSVTKMIGPSWEYPTEGIKVGTGFSLRRWMIPAACGWQGRAIYLDADQLVFGDIQELWSTLDSPKAADAIVACTYQSDKFSRKPWPQTSVMVINCEKAATHPQFRIGNILEALRKNPTQGHYAKFMHATWLNPQPFSIPTRWNHLNVYRKNDTRLLHYTKEPEQPWYKPDHPLAGLWRDALQRAIREGYVTQQALEDAFQRWQVKEDWRNTNGLHPAYRKVCAEVCPGLKE